MKTISIVRAVAAVQVGYIDLTLLLAWLEDTFAYACKQFSYCCSILSSKTYLVRLF